MNDLNQELDNYPNNENEIDKQQRLTIQKFKHFTEKDTRIDSINFEEIIQPYDKSISNLFSENNQIGPNFLYSNNHIYFLPKTYKKKFLDLNDFLFMIENESSKLSWNETSLNSSLVRLDEQQKKRDKLFSYDYINIDEILNRILYKPIEMQLDIVNKCLIHHFLFDLNLEKHLYALRKYLLFENGEFAQTFVDHMSEKLFDNPYPSQIIDDTRIIDPVLMSPIFLNEALIKAKSRIKNCTFVDNLSIIIQPHNKDQSISRDYLKLLMRFELVYKLDWPLNIIINDECMKSYNQIFSFLLQIKFVLNALNNVWYTLKRLSNLKVLFLLDFYRMLLFFL